MKILKILFFGRTSKLQLLMVLIMIFSFVGFSDASYLAAKYYLGEPVTCSVFGGCEEVTTSEYAEIFNISVALLGAFYYLVIFLSAIFYLDTKRKAAAFLVGYFTIVGLLASMWFVFLQFFVIRALCLYCMISAATSTILFILGMLTLRAITTREE